MSLRTIPSLHWLLAIGQSLVVNAALIAVMVALQKPSPQQDPHKGHKTVSSVVSRPKKSFAHPAAMRQQTPAAPAPNAPLPNMPMRSQPLMPAFEPDWGEAGLSSIDGLQLSAPVKPAQHPTSSQKPQLRSVPDLGKYYPEIARKRKIEGITLLQLAVGSNGRVVEAKILKSKPPGVFEQAARAAALNLSYEPTGKRATARLELSWKL